MLKKAIKSILTKRYAISIEQVVPTIEQSNCKMVSFDVFDTLIKRNVPAPKDVFLLLEKQYQRQFGHYMPIYDLRNRAEARACENMKRKTVTLPEIYQAIEEIDEVEREWLMEEEIRIERTLCQRCQPIGKVYDWCISHHIPVILVSDMYLSHETIEGLLHKAGYSGWKRLYISAEEQANKADGTLFDVVLHEEQLNPGELLHIGDSLRGDYLKPREKGIEAVLIAPHNEQ